MHHKFIDEYSHLKSFIHAREARAKGVVFLGLLVAIVAVPRGRADLFLWAFSGLGVLIALSRLPWGAVLVRPLAALVFVAVAGASLAWISGRSPVETLIFLLAKAYLALLTLTLWIGTTPFPELLRALERMRCPRLFILVLSFLYRYLYILIDEFMAMDVAIQSRCPGSLSRQGRWLLSSRMIGQLFVRSYERGEQVYLAMCSRGFDGHIRSISEGSFQRADLVFVFVCIVYFILIPLIWRLPSF